MQALRTLWAIWHHGAGILVVQAFGIVVAFGSHVLAAMVGNWVLNLMGWGLDSLGLMRLLIFWGWIIWAPLGFGIAARWIPSDDLKPDGYPELDRSRI